MDRENYWTRRSGVSRRRFLAASGTLAAGSAAILAGCGDDDDDPTATATGTATTSATTGGSATGTTSATTSATAAPTSAGKVGGTLKTAKASPDTGLDPAITVTNPLHPAKAFSHLLVYHLSQNKVYLDMPSSFEQVDDVTMRFTLRDGIKFAPEAAGGRDVTAEDVAYSLGRFPSTLKNFGSEVNAIQFGWMDSFETPDKKTVVIKLKSPYASAIPSLGSSAFGVVAKELVEANAGKLSDVMIAGSGPYRMTRRESTGTRYERNPNYFKHTPAEGTFVEAGPFIDIIEESVIQDPATAEARFLAGDIDFYPFGMDKLKADELGSSDGVKIAKATAAGNFQFMLDNEKWADHPKLREAASLAIDRDKWIRTLLLGEGQYGSPVGPIFDSVLSQDELKSLQKFDPQRAKALWEEGGGNTVFPNGLRTVSATFDPNGATAVDFVKRELEANLGITVTVNPQDLAGYVSVATSREKPWEFFMASEGSLTTIPDYNALTFYIPTGYGSIFGNQRLDSPVVSNANYAKECSDKFQAQAQELDPEARKKLLQDMQRFFLTNFAPSLPLPVARFTYGAYGERVINYPEADFNLGNPSAGVYRVHNLYLDS